MAISTVDPIFIGASPTNSWLVFLMGKCFNNALTWTKTFGMNFQYAFGGIAGQGLTTVVAIGSVFSAANGKRSTA
ncbi:hypothetical protein [Pandoraea communis]|uniref:hypothetical protein n=1 Tax=Pandoraea communis TaxID=2508297 RepID=UPI0025A53170|nr:hypothetical protein [Pandoraea communis]MDM8356705.1 hypothetical protein [Pandoraea communis]